MTSADQSKLKSQVTSGLLWNSASRIAQQVVQFGLSVALARLLSPEDFGLMAMTLVFTGFAGMLADGGLNTALIQKRELTEAHIHTVFWMTIFVGLGLVAITFALAPWLADFYHAPALRDLFRAISVTFVIGAFGNVPSALLQKQMRFAEFAKIDTVALVISGTVALVLAWRGAGVWSLVAQPIAGSLVTTSLRCWVCRWRPRLVFCWSALREIWRFSGYMFGFLFMNYWARNADNMIIGKWFGSAALGVYSRAYALMLLPLLQFNGVVNQILLPALSGIQDDRERVRRIFLRAIGIIALLACPMMLGLCVVAEPFVLTVYGAKWAGVTPLLQVLALVGMLQSIVSTSGLLPSSQGRSDKLFYWWSLFYLIFIVSFIVGAWLGSPLRVAACYAVANLLYAYPAVAVAGTAVNLAAGKVFRVALGPFLAALAMAAVVAGAKWLLPVSWPPGVLLAILVGIGIATYAAIVLGFNLTAWQDLRQIAREKLGRGEAADQRAHLNPVSP